MENFLKIENLSIDLRSFKLKNLSFSINQGDYLAIIGPTGSGKTIFLEAILGIHKYMSGKIFLKNTDITDYPPEKRKIGIIYQDYALFPHINVYKNIAYGLNNKDDKKIREVAKLLNIESLLERMPETLSGGEKQRVAMARALIVNPDIILMDEPFSALDNVTKSSIRNLMKKLAVKYNITIIHVTHDLDDVWLLANKVAVIKGGKLLQFGSIEEVMYKPANSFIAGFVDTNILSGRVSNNEKGVTEIKVGNFYIYSSDVAKVGEKVKVAFRPEDIIIFKNAPSDSSARNILSGTLIDFNMENKVYYLILKVGSFRIKAIVTKNAFDELNLKSGDEIYFLLKATNVRIYNEI